AEVPAAPVIFITAEFLMCYKIGVSGPGNSALLFVISRAYIIVLKQDGQRSAGGMAVEDARPEQRHIILYSRCGSFLHTSASPFQVCHEVFTGNRQSRGNPIYGYAYAVSVRFAKNRNPEETAKCIHNGIVCTSAPSAARW